MNELCAMFMMENDEMDDHGEVSYAHAILTLESFGIKEDEAITEFLAHFTVDEDDDDEEGAEDDDWSVELVVRKM